MDPRNRLLAPLRIGTIVSTALAGPAALANSEDEECVQRKKDACEQEKNDCIEPFPDTNWCEIAYENCYEAAEFETAFAGATGGWTDNDRNTEEYGNGWCRDRIDRTTHTDYAMMCFDSQPIAGTGYSIEITETFFGEWYCC
jgi:hypothetical protein